MKPPCVGGGDTTHAFFSRSGGERVVLKVDVGGAALGNSAGEGEVYPLARAHIIFICVQFFCLPFWIDFGAAICEALVFSLCENIEKGQKREKNNF